MRRSRFVLIPVLVAPLFGCSNPAPDAASAATQLGSERSAIAYGTVDSTHTAVVSVLIPMGSQSFGECSGTVVQVSGGNAYVLTAAHCCNMATPTIVVAGSNYSV